MSLFNEPGLLSFAIDFANGKLTEEEYIKNRTGNPPWTEARELRIKNHMLFIQYLGRLSPKNRRKAISASQNITQADLMTLIPCGDSTASALIANGTHKVGLEILARYALINRITFSTAKSPAASYEYNLNLFDMFDDLGIDYIVKGSLNEALQAMESHWCVKGCVIRQFGVNDIHLRIERKLNFTIVDILKHQKWSFDAVALELSKQPGYWGYFEYPSVYHNEHFMVFVGGIDKETTTKFTDSQVIGKVRLFDLSSMFGGK
ncbi:hypothetical protein [Paenibacillus sp. LPE1-1-1.1]|uniref:hypothetical protein n=1 Tax=Paenibacillus sp. LPE1-1-1.1 TaxID=3135230 RepID=UPI003415A3E0